MTGKKFCLLVLFALLQMEDCRAQWQPVWTGIGLHDPPVGVNAMTPVNLRVVNDGVAFAAVNVISPGQPEHAGLMRFGNDGEFDWLSERKGGAGKTTGIELLSSGRVAFVGERLLNGTWTIYVRVIEGTEGALVWERDVVAGRLWFDERDDTHQIVEASNGNLMIRLADGGDFVVARISPDGNVLPAWRWSSGLDSAQANDIAAMLDGGVVVAGTTGFEDGYRTVRFNVDGEVVFVDTELGDFGRPQNRARIRGDADGNVLVAASPETATGVLGGMAWKIDPTGKRLWTTELSDQSSPSTTFENRSIALAPDGDLYVAIMDVSAPHVVLIRVRGSDGLLIGETHMKDPSITPRTLALAGNGRVLVGGYANIPGSGGQAAGRIVEFAADGRLCRFAAETVPGQAYSVAWHADSWYVLGRQSDIGFHVRRYDAVGACDGEDFIFADGFEMLGG